MHFDGFQVSVYWATFPSEYLQTIRDVDINLLKNRKEKIKLNHSRRYSLLDTRDRTDFIKEFVALLRFVAAGEANVGFLRKDGVEIHRTTDGMLLTRMNKYFVHRRRRWTKSRRVLGGQGYKRIERSTPREGMYLTADGR